MFDLSLLTQTDGCFAGSSLEKTKNPPKNEANEDRLSRYWDEYSKWRVDIEADAWDGFLVSGWATWGDEEKPWEVRRRRQVPQPSLLPAPSNEPGCQSGAIVPTVDAAVWLRHWPKNNYGCTTYLIFTTINVLQCPYHNRLL